MRVEANLLFYDLTDAEACLLLEQCRRIVLKGEVPPKEPFFGAWCKAAGYDETQALPAYPQRALLSLALRERDKET